MGMKGKDQTVGRPWYPPCAVCMLASVFPPRPPVCALVNVLPRRLPSYGAVGTLTLTSGEDVGTLWYPGYVVGSFGSYNTL